MGDNLFAGLNLDFNFADNLAPATIQPSVPTRGHKRHKSNPDMLNQFAMMTPIQLTREIQMPLPDPVPFTIHGNSDMSNTRGLSFIEDIDMEDILKDFLPDTMTTSAPSTSQLFHAQQLQENVLDIKRKSRHERHLSNPDGLFHHAQQLRQTQQNSSHSQQVKRKENNSSTFSSLLKMEVVPSKIESIIPPRRSKKQNGSTGLSMDMNQIALDLKEETESNRKSYKCGRCGQPKVGHVCTLPDLRNNWSQADLAITRGMKEIDMNCKIVSSRKYTVAHPDHVDHFFGT